MSTFETTVTLLALVTTGLMAGIYLAFTIAVMPGLARSSDSAYVEVMRSINVAILNPAFLVVFVGPAVLSTLAVLGAPDGRTRALSAVALGLYAATLVTTVAVNVPLNNALEQADGEPADVRRAFATRWVPWNALRALLSTGAFVVLAVTLASFS